MANVLRVCSERAASPRDEWRDDRRLRAGFLEFAPCVDHDYHGADEAAV
jgi:hypothetical protein